MVTQLEFSLLVELFCRADKAADPAGKCPVVIGLIARFLEALLVDFSFDPPESKLAPLQVESEVVVLNGVACIELVPESKLACDISSQRAIILLNLSSSKSAILASFLRCSFW